MNCYPAVEMEARVLLLLFTLSCLLAAAGAADVTEPLGESGSAAAPGEEQLYPQRAVETNACLHHISDAGCDTFQCLENTTSKLDDPLHEICTDFLQNAGNFDIQGKQFKDFLKCSAIGIKSRFSSSVTRCAAVQRILVHVQAKCYQQHNICAASNSNIDALVNTIDLNKIHMNGAYLEYVRFLFDCGNNITVAIRSHLQS
ncbi:stanniocalcin-2-like [Pristis pectinata]|uniref:stanniocalcin-2-like n=1 Tax=Pristis pectinata TaxID=685728 RepID=UPI00223DA75D|nr:stanniocalcin-2-like [Pristis pectinata]